MKFVKQHVVKAVAAIAIAGVFAMPAAAQEMKIGVVDLQALIRNAPQTKVTMEALQEEFAPREREFEAKKKEYEDLAEKTQKDLAVMGETERRNAEKDLRELQRDLARLQSEFQEDFNLRQNEEIGKLQRSMLKEVQDYAEQQGYDLIVGDGVLYVNAAVNITDDVLRAVEANYQATSAR
jgi:outer membrane protein